MSNSNGMYNVLNIFKKLEPTQEQQVKAEAQAIYESVEAKGSILEGVKSVEGKLNEKYQGFKKVAAAAKAGGAENPDAVAASIGRKKYGKKAFQKAAAAGKKMGEEQVDEMFAFDAPAGKDRGPRDTGRGDELARREKTLGKGGLGKGKPFGKEYKEKGKYGNTYNIAGPKGVLPEEQMDENFGPGYAPQRRNKPSPGGFERGDQWVPPKAPKKKKEVAEGNREDNPRIPGTQNTAKSRYNPTNKPAPVKKLDKPTDKFDKIKNESVKSRKRQIAEGINFAEMMRDTDDSVAEMLGEIQADIDSFKKTGHASDKLEAFLKIHNHGKRLMGEEGNPRGYPRGVRGMDAMELNPDFAADAPKPGLMGRAASAIATGAKAAGRALGGPGDDELLDRLARDAGNPNRYNEETELNELARLAGLSVSESINLGAIASDMEAQQGRVNVSTNASSDGNKNVTITADGEAADQLMSMLKMAGLSGGAAHAEPEAELVVAEPEVEIEMDEAEEQYANAPEECYQGQDVITHQGDDMNREKKQFAGMPKAGDNPMATPTLQALESMDPMDDMGRRLMREYQSLKLKR